jgi:tellurite resistance protein TehA-like permease
MSGSELSDEHVRQTKKRNARSAALKTIWLTLQLGLVVVAASWLTGRDILNLLIEYSPFMVLFILAWFLAIYRWLNYKAGVGPKVDDPDDYAGP